MFWRFSFFVTTWLYLSSAHVQNTTFVYTKLLIKNCSTMALRSILTHILFHTVNKIYLIWSTSFENQIFRVRVRFVNSSMTEEWMQIKKGNIGDRTTIWWSNLMNYFFHFFFLPLLWSVVFHRRSLLQIFSF